MKIAGATVSFVLFNLEKMEMRDIYFQGFALSVFVELLKSRRLMAVKI